MMNKQHHNMQDQKSSSHPSKSFSSLKVLPRNEVFHFKFIATEGILFEWNVNVDINHRYKWRQYTTLHRLQSSASYSYQFSCNLFFTVDARRLLKNITLCLRKSGSDFLIWITYNIIVINWRPELSLFTRVGNFLFLSLIKSNSFIIIQVQRSLKRGHVMYTTIITKSYC